VNALLALVSTSKQEAALFAELLSLPNDGRYPTLDLTPHQRRQNAGCSPGTDGEAVATEPAADDRLSNVPAASQKARVNETTPLRQ
jgi:hypothetical protein